MIKTRAGSLKVYCEKYRPRLALRTSLLPYERNEEAHIVNIPLYTVSYTHLTLPTTPYV